MGHYSLDTTNFPLYAINSLGNGYFIAAGGGGISKTGIPNAVNVYKMGHEDKKLTATLLKHFTPGAEAVMNVAVHPTDKFCLAAGMDRKCQLIRCKITSDEKDEKAEDKVEMKLINSQIATHSNDEKSEHYQKCVCFTNDGSHVITGSSDGYIKVLKYPNLEIVHEIKAHTADVDDIAVHPNSNTFVSVSRDSTSFVWKLKAGKKDFQLFFTGNQENEQFFKIRNVKFIKDRNLNDSFMYTTVTPSKPQGSKSNLNYVVKWDTHKWIPIKSIEMVNQSPSQLAISPCGTFVGVGCANGSIQIYSSWNMNCWYCIPALQSMVPVTNPIDIVWQMQTSCADLFSYSISQSRNALTKSGGGKDQLEHDFAGQCAYQTIRKNLLQTVNDVHSIFVTGMAFLPTTRLTYEHLNLDTAVLSISVDNNCQLSTLPRQGDYSYTIAITGFVFTIVLIFSLLSFYDVNF